MLPLLRVRNISSLNVVHISIVTNTKDHATEAGISWTKQCLGYASDMSQTDLERKHFLVSLYNSTPYSLVTPL